MSDGPPTGVGEMQDALNEVFHVDNMMEDIGGLVDPEDLPDEEGSGNDTGQDISNGTQARNHEMDLNDDEQHRCMGWYSHCVSKVSVKDTAGVKQVRAVIECLAEQLRELQYQGVQATLLIHVHAIVLHMGQ